MFFAVLYSAEEGHFNFYFLQGGVGQKDILSDSTDAFYVRNTVSHEMIIKDQTLDDTESSASN